MSIRNLLSNSIVYERESNQELRGFCPDPVTGLIWAYTEKELFVVNHWTLLLIRSNLRMKTKMLGSSSFKVPRMVIPAILKRPYVCVKPMRLAKKCVVRKVITISTRETTHWRLSHNSLIPVIIRYYAQTSLSLEEISLLLMENGCRGALKTYLLRKLDLLPAQKKAQRTLLCTWLTEIYLDEINDMSVEVKRSGNE